jgi:Listeria/Bacterioides repeat
MKFKSRCMSIFIVLCIVLSIFSGVAAGDPPVPGALILSKTAVPVAGTQDEWEVTISLNGLDKPVTSDVVLVIDLSLSMNQNNRLVNTKAAAKAFVDNLLTDNSNTRISLVTFSNDSSVVVPFTDDKATLNSAIDGMSAVSYTNIQAGIREASTMLNSPASTADNKFIVLLGDGDPTISYVVTGTTNVSIESCSGTGVSASRTFKFEDDYTITFNYGATVNNGTQYNYSNSAYTLLCPIHSTTHPFPNNHGIPTIYEAKLAKDTGIEIYSVALSAGTNGNYVLSSCSSGGNVLVNNEYYYQMNDNNPSGLTSAFTAIAGKIAYAASNVDIVDPMGEHFILKDGASGVVFKQNGTPFIPSALEFSFNPATQTILWKIDSVRNATSPITMTYTVKVDDGVKPGISLETNGKTTIAYLDVDGASVQKEFHVPRVVYGPFGTIDIHCYLLDASGKPLNALGQVAIQRADLEFDTIPYTSGGFQTLLYDNVSGTPYIVGAPVDHVFNGKTAYYVPGNSSNFGDPASITIRLDETNQTGHAYFAYQFPVTSSNLTYYENNAEYSNVVLNMPASPVTVGDGMLISEPSEPISVGYKFEGWYTEQACNNLWDFNNDIVSGDVGLYAKWTEVTTPYTVTFDADGGLPIPSSQPVQHSGFITEPTQNPVKVGHDFVQWVENPSDLRAFDFNNTRVTSDLTIYAQYESNSAQHTVKFDTDGGTPSSIPNDIVDHNALATEPSIIPVKVGNNFVRWVLSGTSIAYDFSTPVTSDLNLTAVYTPNTATYTVVFYGYDGTQIQSLNGVPHNSVISPIANPFRVGYEFDEWKLNSASGTTYNFATPVTSNLYLYASYIDMTNVYYPVTFDGAGGSPVPASLNVQHNDNFTEPSEIPLKSGNDFVEWRVVGDSIAYDFDDPVTSGLDLIAIYTSNNTLYDVTFDADGGSPVPPIERVPVHDNATQPTDPTKSGYRFIHWYESMGSVNARWDFDTIITADMTLVARWDRIGGGGGNGGGTIVDPPTRQPTEDPVPDIGMQDPGMPDTEMQPEPDSKANENEETTETSRVPIFSMIFLYFIAILFGCYRYRINQKEDE